MNNESLAREAAEQCREEFGLGANPVLDLVRFIETKVNVGVASLTAGNGGHGMTMSLGDTLLIAASCTQSPMRLRSTLAHELGHIRLNSVELSSHHKEWGNRSPEEIQADSFARHFLLPLEAVRKATINTAPSVALLSNLVQDFRVSPTIAAIQLRESGAINQQICDSWKNIISRDLAFRFGWLNEYESLSAESARPRPPQLLMARAIEAYRWRVVSPAAVSRLDETLDPNQVIDELAKNSIEREPRADLTAQQPSATVEPLTSDELSHLRGDSA